jgi:hypothetical protein
VTDYIWVGLDSVLNKSHIAHITWAFYALKTSLKILASYYADLHPTPSDLPVDSHYFSSITAYCPNGSEHTIKFEYVSFLENCPVEVFGVKLQYEV